MKIVVLGVSGLIGRYVFSELSSSFDVIGTTTKNYNDISETKFFSKNKNILYDFKILNYESCFKKLEEIQPKYILNCIGITKRKINDNILDVLEVNSVFPHKLARWSQNFNIKIIHFSTDCVFDGNKGYYSDLDIPNAKDLYGKSKGLGEIIYDNALTIRSSFIGFEQFDKTELLEWVLSQNNKSIFGYKKTMYSGVSALFLAQFVKKIILEKININGLFNLAPKKPISKYDLIKLIILEFNLNINLIPEKEKIHNPTLNGEELRKKIDFKIPNWTEMIKDLIRNKI